MVISLNESRLAAIGCYTFDLGRYFPVEEREVISRSARWGTTVLWVLFEYLEYHLLTLVYHCLILSLAILFVWSNVAHFINKSPPHIPHPHISEEPVLQIAFAITIEINMGFAILQNIASGRDLKKFLTQLIFSCGGTRGNQQECLVGQQFYGFCLNALNTICSL